MSFESASFAALAAPTAQAARPGDMRLAGWLAKSLASVMLAALGLVFLSLATWSVGDPSLTHAITGPTRNWLGPVGAIVSDLIFQLLGLASLIALMPPAAWAMQLYTDGRIAGLRSRVLFAPMAIVCLAAALSALPVVGGWQLKWGFGGLLGDTGLGLASKVLQPLIAGHAATVAGVSALVAGLGLLQRSLGLSLAEVTAALKPDAALAARMAALSKRIVVPAAVTVPAIPTLARTRAEPAMPIPQVAAVAPPAIRTEPAFSPQPTPPVAPATVVQQGPTALPVAMAPPISAPITAQAPPQVARVEAPRVFEAPLPPLPAPPPQAQPQPTFVAPLAPVETPQLPASLPGSIVDDTLSDLQSEAVARRFAPAAVADARPATLPSPGLLARSSVPRLDAAQHHAAESARAARILAVLDVFGIKGRMAQQLCGPVVTSFAFEPQAGTSAQRAVGHAEDIAASLGVAAVRVVAVAGTTAVRLEVPHNDAIDIRLGDFLAAPEFQTTGLPLALGSTVDGDPVIADLVDLSGILLAGDKAADRAGVLSAFIAAILLRHTAQTCRLVVIDPAGGTLASLNGLPHLMTPVITDPTGGVSALSWAAADVETRTRPGQNATALVLVVSDLSALQAVDSAALVRALTLLSQRGAAANIHVVAATSASGDGSLPADIKRAFRTRIALSLAQKQDSRDMIGVTGADALLPGGDALMTTSADVLVRRFGRDLPVRLHAPRVEPKELTAVAVASVRVVEVTAPAKVTAPVARAAPLSVALASGVADDVYDRAVAAILREKIPSPTFLKRSLGVSYQTAIDILADMERDGLVTAPDSNGQRRIAHR